MKEIRGFSVGDPNKKKFLTDKKSRKKPEGGNEEDGPVEPRPFLPVVGMAQELTDEHLAEVDRYKKGEIENLRRRRFTEALNVFNLGILNLRRGGKIPDEKFAMFSILNNKDGTLLDEAEDFKIALNELIEEFSKDVINNTEVLELCNDFLQVIKDLPNITGPRIIKGFSG